MVILGLCGFVFIYLPGLLLFTFLLPSISFCVLSSSEECGISALGHFIQQPFTTLRFPHPLPLIFPMIANFLTSQTCKLKRTIVFPNQFPTQLFASVQMLNTDVASPSHSFTHTARMLACSSAPEDKTALWPHSPTSAG